MLKKNKAARKGEEEQKIEHSSEIYFRFNELAPADHETDDDDVKHTPERLRVYRLQTLEMLNGPTSEWDPEDFRLQNLRIFP